MEKDIIFFDFFNDLGPMYSIEILEINILEHFIYILCTLFRFNPEDRFLTEMYNF